MYDCCYHLCMIVLKLLNKNIRCEYQKYELLLYGVEQNVITLSRTEI